MARKDTGPDGIVKAWEAMGHAMNAVVVARDLCDEAASAIRGTASAFSGEIADAYRARAFTLQGIIDEITGDATAKDDAPRA